MYQAPTSPAGIGGVLDDGFRLFKACFMDCLPFLIGMSIAGIVPSLMMPDTATLLENPDQMAEMFGAAFFGAYLVSMVVQVVCFSGSVAAIQRRVNGVESSLAASFATALSRLPAMVVAAILMLIAITIGFLLLVIPGIWASIALLLFGYCCVVDGDGPLQSLKSSIQLVKGNWWRTAVIMTVVFIIFFVIYVLIAFVVGAVLGVGAATGDINAEDVANAQTSPLLLGITSLLGVPVVMFLIATQYAVYADLKLRRLGDDLDSRIAEV